jgi:protease-4
MIRNHSTSGLLSSTENPVSLLQQKLKLAEKDDRVKAVVLRLNTPGGTVTGSDAMYREVARFKEKTKKPVVSMMMDISTSGGYYVACATDRLVAYPSTVTGSIGVIMQLMSVHGAMQMIGVRANTITSGGNKSAGSPFESLSDEQRAIFQAMVDDFYGNFVEKVKAARPLIQESDLGWIADGRVFTGRQALDAGLVDELGDIYDAFDAAKSLAGIGKAKMVIYHRGSDARGSVYATSPSGPAGGTQINLGQVNLSGLGGGEMGGAAFLYVWQPGM